MHRHILEADAPDRQQPAPGRGGARPRLRPPRLSAGHVVMLVAAVTAALANMAVLRPGDAGAPFLVAARDLPAGTPLDPGVVRGARAPLDAAVAATLLAPRQLDELDGEVTAGAVPAGSPIRVADLREPSGPAGHRRLSVPVDRQRAVGGDVRVGDRIDVIAVGDGEARYIVSGARVLGVLDDDTPSLAGPSRLALTIAVPPDTALCVAAAVDAGEVTVVLSTGQSPVPTTPCPAPRAGAGP